MHRTVITLGALASTALLGAAALTPASAQTAIRLISEGDTYDPFGLGDPNDFESVEALGDPALNATGGFAARARTIVAFDNTGLDFLFSDPTGADGFSGSIIHEESMDAVTVNGNPFFIAGYSSTVSISDAGVVSYGANVVQGGSQVDGIVVGTEVRVLEGDPISDLPGQSLGNAFFRGSTGDGNTQYFSGRYGSDNIGIFKYDDTTGDITTLLKTGDAVGAGNAVLPESQGNFFGNTAVSRSNDRYITNIDIDPSVFSPSNPFPITDALVVDGAIPTATGSSSLLIDDVLIPGSAGGLAGEVWEGFNEKAINASGSWVSGATTNADDLGPEGEWVIVHDGEIIFRGDGTILGVAINDAGDVAFSYQDTIYLNGAPVVEVGTPIDTGETIARMQFGLALSERNASNEVTLAFSARDSTDPLTGSFGPDLYAFVAQLALDGDYNDDGSVDQGDLDLVLLNWGDDASVTGVPAGWVNMQPTGLIGQTELDGVLLNWGNTAETGSSGNPVPEPQTLAFFAGLALSWCGRRSSVPGR